MSSREQKWHLELNTRFSVIFWDSVRKLCASICNENSIKWLQFQIIRNSLQTNYIVSHFVNNVGPQCKFCQNSAEVVSHLYWTCLVVSGFLNDIFDYITGGGFAFRPTKYQFLFGFLDEKFDSPKNYITLALKKFIWINKFKMEVNLSIVGFVNYFTCMLKDLKRLYDLKEKSAEFNVWGNLLVLFPVADLEVHHGQPPPQVPNMLLQPATP